MKRIALLFVGTLIGLQAFAQSGQIEFQAFDLDNGLHVILHEDHSTPIVAISVLYHVGSKNEDPERTGFAHFFEHLLFEGSKNIERGEYTKHVERAGGTLNANTSNDRTFYYEILPSNQLALGLWLESERMLHAKVDKVGIETQREVVKEEKRLRVDNRPYGSIFEEVLKRAYTEHPYRWTPIGSMDHIDAAKESEFVTFYETFYVPNNAVLSIAGDIDLDSTMTLVQKYFGEIPASEGEVPRPQIKEPKQVKEIRDTVYDNIQLPAIVQAYHIPSQGNEDFYAVDMLATLLSNGQSSRLYKRLVDQEQKSVMVGIFPLAMEDDPGISITLSIANAGIGLEEIEKTMEEEINRLKTEMITDKELQKLKNQIEMDFVSRNSKVAGIAESLANYHTYLGDANLINTEIDRYKSVSKADIQRVAKKYFTPSNRVVLYYLPKSL